MTSYEARIRIPAAIDATVAGPYAEQLLQHPTDGRIVAQEGDPEAGSLRIVFEADDQLDAEMHAQLLTGRAPGCSVERVQPA
ncbi:hypothetical protein [Actinotalea sp. K2]|uniref:hypothetical protein n=1 Tax=Actinotalea sp. K2 TaxID=2939438 RepID=UPI002016E8C5|nr:hypothetical protein [Actinotalea sp. K2]MCL3862926.1 hypothetical protein [Actinotalea sp. K2]